MNFMGDIFRRGVLMSSAALLVLSGGLALAQKGEPSDMRFARDAAAGGMAEVQMGQLAVRKASNERVKQFGQRMIDDHTKAGDQLKIIASKDSIGLPSELNAHDKLIYDNLSKLDGTAFDRAYMQDMVKDHQTDVNEFQKEASNGANPDLKSFATTTLPTLQEHLRIARETNNSLGTRSSR
jgi:putative membrane protein